MGFKSYDDLISEISVNNKKLILPWWKYTGVTVANNWYSMWPVNGMPGPGALYTGTALTHQRTADTTAGALYSGGNKSTDTKHLLSSWVQAQTIANQGYLMIVDQVGYYPITPSGIQQTFDQVATLPDRYVGAGESGLQAVLVGVTANAAGCNLTEFTYYNQAGAQKSCPVSVPVALNAAASTTVAARITSNQGLPAITLNPFMPLAAGDTGMRYLKTCTFDAAKNLMAFVLVRPLAFIPIGFNAGISMDEEDFVMKVANLERIYDGACLSFLFYRVTATAVSICGFTEVTWG